MAKLGICSLIAKEHVKTTEKRRHEGFRTEHEERIVLGIDKRAKPRMEMVAVKPQAIFSPSLLTKLFYSCPQYWSPFCKLALRIYFVHIFY